MILYFKLDPGLPKTKADLSNTATYLLAWGYLATKKKTHEKEAQKGLNLYFPRTANIALSIQRGNFRMQASEGAEAAETSSEKRNLGILETC